MKYIVIIVVCATAIIITALLTGNVEFAQFFAEKSVDVITDAN